jgi:hypothetical protein
VAARTWEQECKLAAPCKWVAPCKLVELCKAKVRRSVVARLADKLWAGSKGRKPESLTAD